MKKRFNLFGIVLALVFFASVFSFVSAAEESLAVDALFLKLSVREGGSISKSFTVRGLDDSNVMVGAINLVGVRFSEDSFFLASGESKEIEVMFDSTDISPGAYVGHIALKSGSKYYKLPVVLEIESEDVIFDLNLDIPPLYNEVAPGNPVLARISVFDLTVAGGIQEGLSPESVEISYFIFRSDGVAIVSETDSVVVSHDSGFTKSVMLADDLQDGTYFITALVRYGSSVGVSSGTFSVVKRIGGVRTLSLSWAIALFAVLAIVGLLMFFFFLLVRDRDRFILALKEYHDVELKKQKEFLVEQQKVLITKGVPVKVVRAEVKEKVKKLKVKQKKRMKTLKNLSRNKSVGLMEKTLNSWKKKGYNTLLLESKLKELSKGDMKSLISKWKKQGYIPPKK